MKGFYTYMWLRENGIPYYIGKGCGRRAIVSDGHNCYKPPDSQRILIQYYPTEKEALAAERFLIEYYGRKDLGSGCLRNRTNGGDGVSGYVYTKDFKHRMSMAVKKAFAAMPQRTRCPYRHLLTPENVYTAIRKDGRTHRSCRICRLIRNTYNNAKRESV